jgi:hypothetical protein
LKEEESTTTKNGAFSVRALFANVNFCRSAPAYMTTVIFCPELVHISISSSLDVVRTAYRPCVQVRSWCCDAIAEVFESSKIESSPGLEIDLSLVRLWRKIREFQEKWGILNKSH